MNIFPISKSSFFSFLGKIGAIGGEKIEKYARFYNYNKFQNSCRLRKLTIAIPKYSLSSDLQQNKGLFKSFDYKNKGF